MSSSTRTPSFSLSLHALLTFPIRVCNPPPAASSVRSCKITPLIKVSLDDVLNKRHLPPLTLKDFEEWLVFVEGKPQYLYFLLWLKEYESRYASWLAEFGFSYYPTTRLSSPSDSSLKSSGDSHNNNSNHNSQGLAVPTAANINYIPPSPSLALFFTRAKKTFLDPTASPASPYTLPYSALSTLIPQPLGSTHSLSASIPHFNTASRPDLVDINERWKHASRALFGPESHPHPHPKEFAALANHIRGVLKDSLERFAVSACHNVGTRRAWCGLAGGIVIVLLLGVLPTLLAFFYGHSRWIRLVGFLGCWLGGTVIFSSLHGICMMIYLFGDLRQLRSFELVKPAISNPRAIARARPRLRSFFTKTGEEEKPSVKEKQVPSEQNHRPNGGGGHPQKADQKDNNIIDKGIPGDHGPHQPVVVPPASLPASNDKPSPSSALVTATNAPAVKLGFPIAKKDGENTGDGIRKGEEVDADMKPTHHRDNGEDDKSAGDHRLPLQLSTILSTRENALSPIAESPLSISASVSPASSVGDFKEKKPQLDVPVGSSTSLQSNVSTTTDLVESESDESGSSSDHGIVISPAFETSMRYGHQDEWMWESGGHGDGKEKGSKETWTTSRNTSASSPSPASRVMSAFGSVIQWATFGVSSQGRRRGDSSVTSGGGSAVSNTSCKADTSISVAALANDNDEKAQISSSSTTPHSPMTTVDAAARPVSHSGTFGVRSWIVRPAQDDKNVPYSRRSSTRSVSTRPSSWDRHMSPRASRWSRGFGFNFGLGVHSVPEEGVYEGDPEGQVGNGTMSTSVHARTCPAEGYYCETQTDTYGGVESSSSFHARSTSQAQTIESFYAPPRDRESIFGTTALVHNPNAPIVTTGTIPADQCTASFIPREYAAEVLPDLESVPRVSLSMSRASGERDCVVKEKDANPSKVSPPRVPPRGPVFDFEGLPGLKFEDENEDNDGDEDENKENIPVEPIVPLRPVRPRPPRLQLHTSASAPALVAAASPQSVGASRAIPPISPALPSSPFTHSVVPGTHPAIDIPSSPSVPLPVPPKTKSSKFWFDTCPRHPAVEAKIAEAAALEEQEKRNAGLIPPPTPRSPASFWSTSASGSASAPSTFHFMSKALPKGDTTYPYPYASPSHNRTWTSKMKDTLRNIAGPRTPSPIPIVPAPSTRPSSAQLSSNFLLSNDSEDSSSVHWRSRLKSVTSVPAFGPLTRVLSPLVSRGQWEIVVRSAAYAFLSVWVWLGVILSLPVLRVR